MTSLSLDILTAADYVICATLRKVADVFDVGSLWTRTRSGLEGTALLEALRRYPRTSRTRPRREIYYSQVIVRIPERDYVRDDRLEEGMGRRTLLRELPLLHQQELGNFLEEHTPIRYRVEPDPTLRPGEVQFLFGRAIYVPDVDEASLYQIEATAEGRDEWRIVGPIYLGQRLTLLNGFRHTSTFPVNGWPFNNGESILLMLRSAPTPILEAVAEPPGCLMLSREETGGFLARDRRNRGLRLRVTTEAGASQTAMAQLEKQALSQALPVPVTPHPAVLASVSAPRQNIPLFSNPSEEGPKPGEVEDLLSPPVDHRGRREPVLRTDLLFNESISVDESREVSVPSTAAFPHPPSAPILQDQLTWVPGCAATEIQIVGVALHRLSTYASSGIRVWRISFNRSGRIVLEADLEAVAGLCIDSTDRVFGESTNGRVVPLALPGAWPLFPEWELILHSVPEALQAHYLGWVQLPTSLHLSIPRGRAIHFGRGPEAELAPRLLADPRALRWRGTPPQAGIVSAEYLGLSRRHVQLQACHQHWEVQLTSRNMPVYRLTSSGTLQEILAPGAHTTTLAKPGELLVVGGYVLSLGML